MINCQRVSDMRQCIALGVILLLLAGCSSVPSLHISEISSTQSKIVILDSNMYLRTFDPATEKWSPRISFGKIEQIPNYQQTGRKMIRVDNEVFIQLAYGKLYKINDSEGLKFVATLPYGEITAIDQNYYYFGETFTDSMRPGWFEIKNFRVNRQTLTVEKGHLSEYPQLTVVDAKRYSNIQAYLCRYIKSSQINDNSMAEYQSYLLIKPLDMNLKENLVAFPYEFKGIIMYRLAGDKFVPTTGNGITFITPAKFFSKLCSYDNQQGFHCCDEYISAGLSSVEQLRNVVNVAWRLDGSVDNHSLQGVDTISGKRIYFYPPNTVHIGTGAVEHLWGNSVWCSGYRFRKFVGDSPYLVRFNLPDGKAKGYELSPGFIERVETVWANFVRYLNPVTYLGPG